jgi:hypothetical protein
MHSRISRNGPISATIFANSRRKARGRNGLVRLTLE